MMNRVNYEGERNVMTKGVNRYMPSHSTCVVCGHMIFGASEFNKCPGCKNSIGFSTNVVKVNSIGKMIRNEQIGENEFAFMFEFDYEGFEDVKPYFDKTGQEKPALGVTLLLDTANGFGFAGVHCSAVFNHDIEVDVELEEEQAKELTESILTDIIGFNPLPDKNIQPESKSSKPISEKKPDTSENILSLLEIAEDMYSMVEHFDFIADRDEWNKIPNHIKEDVAKILQSNEKHFIEFINCTRLRATKDCCLQTQSFISDIIHHVAPNPESMDNEEKYFELETGEESRDELKDLKEALTDSKRCFAEYTSFEHSNRLNKFDMISIHDCNDKECLWIVKSELGYKVFDKVDLYDNYRVFNIPNSNTLEFDNLNDLMNLITKISPEKTIVNIKKEESLVNNREDNLPDVDLISNKENVKAMQDFIKEEYSDNSTESLAKKNLKRAQRRVKSKKAFRREWLLEQIKELSDEDLLNELKRRMASK